jgi:2-hydroxycyclohexanecarboxyl-CoA dehydrogenase
MSVSDKTAVVTGAGSKRGIGRATANALAAAGWNIAVPDLDEASAKDTANEVAERHGVQSVGVGCDVTDESSVENALATIEATLHPIGALVNNAGITSPTPFLQVTGEEWDRMFAVNVRGSYNITRRVAPGMAERGFGRIVFLSSVSAERGGGSSGASRTRPPRPASSGSPARWLGSWDRGASPPTRSRRG